MPCSLCINQRYSCVYQLPPAAHHNSIVSHLFGICRCYNWKKLTWNLLIVDLEVFQISLWSSHYYSIVWNCVNKKLEKWSLCMLNFPSRFATIRRTELRIAFGRLRACVFLRSLAQALKTVSGGLLETCGNLRLVGNLRQRKNDVIPLMVHSYETSLHSADCRDAVYQCTMYEMT